MKRASESDIDAGVAFCLAAAEGEMKSASDSDMEAGVSTADGGAALGVVGRLFPGVFVCIARVDEVS